MRKTIISMTILFSIFLSGCSLLEEVNNSLDYVDKATDLINTWDDFGQEAPQMIQEAVANPEIKAALEEKLSALLVEVKEFNLTEAPAIAEEIHQKLVEKNEELTTIIENAMTNGELKLTELENSPLFSLISEVTRLMNAIEDLGL
ncbi:DUF6376 family protein [Anaerobacillus isosaccharinicus]|uniref:Lipoprotein n=1 Tax=Anaerobacillus isosaccharinicus TaxID=1532552 RepID=A0A1S2L549_9BACI|nr:DUF6376 family protein [Anaerobacillus isosaccharinicus]MBA5584977.1 hypothetical protein [Anaerobacillus isosaccharinicus]QOY36669.1 hypothetical protein AWH56_003060 [Anaerobacillus isosaccharinicus]